MQPAAGGVGGFGSLGAAAGGFGVPRAPGAFGAAPGGAAPGAFGAPAAGGYGQQQQAVGTKSVQYQPKVIPQNGGKDAGKKKNIIIYSS